MPEIPDLKASRKSRDRKEVWRRGIFKKVHFLEVLENSDMLEILEIPLVKRPLS